MLGLRGGDMHGKELHRPPLRLRALTSALFLLQAAESRLRAQAACEGPWLSMRAAWTEVRSLQ